MRGVRQFHARAREGSIVSRCFLRSANFLLQNCAIPRNAARIGFVPSTYEKQAVQRCENIRNSLGLNYKSDSCSYQARERLTSWMRCLRELRYGSESGVGQERLSLGISSPLSDLRSLGQSPRE